MLHHFIASLSSSARAPQHCLNQLIFLNVVIQISIRQICEMTLSMASSAMYSRFGKYYIGTLRIILHCYLKQVLVRKYISLRIAKIFYIWQASSNNFLLVLCCNCLASENIAVNIAVQCNVM
jgi:hypothetical protein